MNAEKKSCIIFDEAYRGFSSTGSLSEINRVLRSLLMEIGQKNLFIIVVLPTIFSLDKYIAVWRARGLFHIFKSKTQKGYWRFFNQKKKLMLYSSVEGKKFYKYSHIRTGFKGRFYNYYAVDETEYRKKKDTALKMGYKMLRAEKYLEQRNKLFLLIRKEYNLKLDEMLELLKKYRIGVKQTALYSALKEISTKESIDIGLKDEKEPDVGTKKA